MYVVTLAYFWNCTGTCNW